MLREHEMRKEGGVLLVLGGTGKVLPIGFCTLRDFPAGFGTDLSGFGVN